MRNELEEAMKAVSNVNEDIFSANKFLDKGYDLILKATGFIIIVEFVGVQIWNSDNDERELDEHDEYEPLEPYLRNQIQKICDDFMSLCHEL